MKDNERVMRAIRQYLKRNDEKPYGVIIGGAIAHRLIKEYERNTAPMPRITAPPTIHGLKYLVSAYVDPELVRPVNKDEYLLSAAARI